MKAPMVIPCGICCGDRLVLDYAEVTTMRDAETQYVPTRIGRCPTPRCGEVCKLCRREPGDVHGPDCGPLMADKLDRPHIITKEDCR
jgi:hypothetical protein